jgi:hypothetical protein
MIVVAPRRRIGRASRLLQLLAAAIFCFGATLVSIVLFLLRPTSSGRLFQWTIRNAGTTALLKKLADMASPLPLQDCKLPTMTKEEALLWQRRGSGQERGGFALATEKLWPER